MNDIYVYVSLHSLRIRTFSSSTLPAKLCLMATLSQLVSPSISFCICFRTESLAQSFFSSQVFFLSPFMSAVQHLYRNLDTRIPALHTHTHPFNGPFSETTRVSQYQKGKTSLDFTEARDSDWQWHQLGCMQVCISLQTDNHASTQPLSFLQGVCPSFCQTNSVKALKAPALKDNY